MMKTKILFVDNDADFLETRREFLEGEGNTVIPAFSHLDAKQKLEHETADLAVIDIRLINDDDEKDISGLELAKEISHFLPVIILTGYHSEEYMRQALGLQFDGTRMAYDFLVKEQGPAALLSAIRRTLEISRQAKHNKPSAALFYRTSPGFLAAGMSAAHKISPGTALVKLNVTEQMYKDYELARLHAQWMGWARLALVSGGVIVFLFGIIMAILGYRDVGIIGAITGAITGTVGGLTTRFANDANRRWEQFHKELIFFYKESSQKRKGGK